MPVRLGIWDSPGAALRRERFITRQTEALDMIEPLVYQRLEQEVQQPSPFQAQAEQWTGQVMQPGRAAEPPQPPGLPQEFAPTGALEQQEYAFRGVTPTQAGGLVGQEFAQQVGERPGIAEPLGRIAATGLTPREFAALPYEEQVRVTGGPPIAQPPAPTPLPPGPYPGPFAGFEPGEIVPALGAAGRTIGAGLEAAAREAPGAILGRPVEVAPGRTEEYGLFPALRREVEFFRRYTEPVGGALGRGLGEVLPGVPWPARKLGIPDVPGRQPAIEAFERAGEVVAPEVLVPTNLIPIPIVDDVLRVLARGIPLAARLLSREGRMATRAELSQLVNQIKTFGRKTPAVAGQADQAVVDIERALLRPEEVAPEAVLPTEPGVAEAAVPSQAVPAEAAPRPAVPEPRAAEAVGETWEARVERLRREVYEPMTDDDIHRALRKGQDSETFVYGGSQDAGYAELRLRGRVPIEDVPIVSRTDVEVADDIVYSVQEPLGAGEIAAGTRDPTREVWGWTSRDAVAVLDDPDAVVLTLRVRPDAPTTKTAPKRGAVAYAPDDVTVISKTGGPDWEAARVGVAAPPEAVPSAQRRPLGIEPEDILPAGVTDPAAPARPRHRRLGGAAEVYAGPLRGFDQVVAEVVTSENPIQRALIGKTGINPSILENTPVGRAITAYWRQRVAAEELSDLAVSAALDVHAQRFTGLRPNIVIPQIGGRKGLVTNITPKREGASRVWQDVYSRPDDYVMTAAQRAEIDDFHRVIDEMEFLRTQAGLDPRATRGPKAVEEGWLYTPRQVKGIRGAELQRPSSPKFQRHYEEAVDGRARGIDYDVDPRATSRLHTGVAYKEIADKQFSDHVERLQAEAMQRGERLFVTPKELMPERVLKRMSDAVLERLGAERELRGLRAAMRSQEVGLAERGVAGRAARLLRAERRPARQQLATQIKNAETSLVGVRQRYQAVRTQYSKALEAARRAEVAPGNLFGEAEDTIPIAQWRNRFFKREDTEKLRAGIDRFFEPDKQSPWVRGPTVLGNYIRFFASVGDFAEPFIQGQLVFGADPPAWARSALRHYQAFFDPSVQSRIMRDYLPEFQEMAAHGTPVGDPEFFAALRAGGGVSTERLFKLLPKGDEVRHLLRVAGRQTFGRFQASYNTGLGSSRAMLTRVMKDTIADVAERQAFVRNATGGLDSRALGVGPGQRAVEGFLGAFSPRFLRSTLAMMTDLRLGLRNPRGRAAWMALGTLASTATGVYVLSGLALGKSWEEIRTGLNPTEGKKFLSHEVNDDWIGIGGQVRSITHLLAHMATDPEGLLDWDMFDNPLIAFYMSRGAPALGILGGATEAVTGGQLDVLPFDKIEGVPDFFKHLGTSALPFVVQGILEGEQAITAGFGLVGMRTSAETPGEELRRLFEEKHGRPYNRETDRVIAEQDEALRPLLYQSEARERITAVSSEAAERLLPFIEGVRRGDSEAGSGLVRQYSNFKTYVAGATADAYADVDFDEAESEAGRLRDELGELNPFSEEFFDPITFQTDWRAFDEERDRLINEIEKLAPGFRDSYEARLRLPVEMQDVEGMLIVAGSLRDELGDISRVLGLTVQEYDEIRDFLRTVARARQYWLRPENGGRDVPLEDAVLDTLRHQNRGPNFSRAALTLRGGVPDELRNPEYEVFLREHEAELRLFYPDLYTRRIQRQIAGIPETAGPSVIPGAPGIPSIPGIPAIR